MKYVDTLIIGKFKKNFSPSPPSAGTFEHPWLNALVSLLSERSGTGSSYKVSTRNLHAYVEPGR